MCPSAPRISVVDDESSVRKAIQRLIRSAGMDVVTFSSGVEFLATLPAGAPDCVVLDLHMPGLTGFDVQARLAKSESKVPVIIITGHDTPEARTRALAGGASAYLLKPVDDSTLLTAIEDAIQRKERTT